MRLEGKTVLITGAGSGIGRALAIEADKRGMIVGLCGRRPEPLAETLALMRNGRAHITLRGDLTVPLNRRNLSLVLSDVWGRLDFLVNNAGLVTVGEIEETNDTALEQLMATNLVAPLALIRELLPLLKASAPSRIVNVGSMFGEIPFPLFAAYSASKFGLRGASIALRRELASARIGVTFAAPRATRTDAATAFDELIEPMQMKLDSPENVARQIWAGVAKDADVVYPRGPERFFVLVQRLFPALVDRSISKQLEKARKTRRVKMSPRLVASRNASMDQRETAVLEARSKERK
jgi:short-subunit dehydrogenase